MDRKAGDDGRLTPLEQIKAEHDLMRVEILEVGDDIEWSHDVLPQQVGLSPVLADESGHLWFVTRDGDKPILKRIWHLS